MEKMQKDPGEAEGDGVLEFLECMCGDRKNVCGEREKI
jgi:hypothetical protein